MKKNKGGYKIFLIEDNIGDVTLIEEYIDEQFSSAEITVARDYKQAISILTESATSFDILLLDLSLPDKSGEDLINSIVANTTANCPIIILTGYADIDFSLKSISLGISDYLLKDELTAAMLHKSIVYAIERCEFKTGMQESEKRFSILFNLSPQPKWVYDLELSKIINVNEAALIHYGYSKDEFYDLELVQLHVAEEREVIEKALKNFDNTVNTYSGSFRHLKKNGKEIEVELYSTFLVIDDRPCCTVIAIDVTEKNMAERKLTEAIIKTQEDERYAIGSELHDNICQILAGCMLNLISIRRNLDDEKSTVLMMGIENIKLASNEIRNLSHRLAPAFFDDMNLKDDLLQLLKSIDIEGGFETDLYFDPELNNLTLKRDLQINIYRMLQEQINNIIKYAQASRIKVSLSLTADQLLFEIADNGVGFEEEKVTKGIGFANMTRRAKLYSGSFNYSASPGNGCKITVSIPADQIQ